jgi:hypothetical protein
MSDSSSERDRKLIANLISRSVKRIHTASIEKYEDATIKHVAIAVSRERLLIGSWIRGVFDDLGHRELSREIENALSVGDYVGANERLRQAIDLYAYTKKDMKR